MVEANRKPFYTKLILLPEEIQEQNACCSTSTLSCYTLHTQCSRVQCFVSGSAHCAYYERSYSHHLTWASPFISLTTRHRYHCIATPSHRALTLLTAPLCTSRSHAGLIGGPGRHYVFAPALQYLSLWEFNMKRTAVMTA